MPFDDTENGGGENGGGDRHDPEGLEEMAQLSLLQLSANCEINSLCEFHAGLWMQGMMVQGLVNTVQKCSQEQTETALDMLSEQIAALEGQLETLKEERKKHVQ